MTVRSKNSATAGASTGCGGIGFGILNVFNFSIPAATPVVTGGNVGCSGGSIVFILIDLILAVAPVSTDAGVIS